MLVAELGNTEVWPLTVRVGADLGIVLVKFPTKVDLFGSFWQVAISTTG